jgi:hypothetical protein
VEIQADVIAMLERGEPIPSELERELTQCERLACM